jgi:hypothetical protein
MAAQFKDLLREASETYRRYEAGQSMSDAVENAIAEFEGRFPDEDWKGRIQEIAPGWSNPDPNGDDILAIYETRALVRWGRSNVDLFRTVLGVALPQWAEEFYSNVICAFLPMLNQIRILTVEEAIAHEANRREMFDESAMTGRLIRFAEGDPTGLGFSFYQRLGSLKWGIVATNRFKTRTPQQESEEWALEETDADIDAWLRRMLATDGHPLIIDNEFEPMAWRRIVAGT